MKAAEATRGTDALYLDVHRLRFHRSAGGLLALTVREEDGSETHYDRVIVLRAFPLTAPEEHLSIRLPNGARSELGMLRRLSDLDEEGERLVREELATRYFMPRITRVLSFHRRRAVYMDVECDLGRRRITMRDNVSSVRHLEDGRILFTDVDGTSYELCDPKSLDKASYRRIEVFL